MFSVMNFLTDVRGLEFPNNRGKYHFEIGTLFTFAGNAKRSLSSGLAQPRQPIAILSDTIRISSKRVSTIRNQQVAGSIPAGGLQLFQ